MAAQPSVHEPADRVEHRCRMRVVGYLHGVRAARAFRDGTLHDDRVPSQQTCTSPLLAGCVDGCGRLAAWACSNHRESKCVPCATRYRRRVGRLFEHGLTRLDRATSGFLYGWTITAPSSDLHQRYRPGRRGRHGLCTCHLAMAAGPAAWNGRESRRFHRLMTWVKKKHPGLQYVSAVEVQDGKRGGQGRGLLHRHVLMWSPTFIAADELNRLSLEVGYGCVMDLQDLPLNANAAARYAAKYVSKSVDQRGEVPWSKEYVDVTTGEVTERTDANFRTWSKTNDWGITMAEIKATNLASARAAAARLSAPPATHLENAEAPAAACSGPEPPD